MKKCDSFSPSHKKQQHVTTKPTQLKQQQIKKVREKNESQNDGPVGVSIAHISQTAPTGGGVLI